jgi:hypothetical protein
MTVAVIDDAATGGNLDRALLLLLRTLLELSILNDLKFDEPEYDGK